MSNYTKATNFATKDTLPTGDAGKIVKGTEIDNEFNAIASAISSKADTASPTFTGTPAGPTASAGTSTTQLATTAFVAATVQSAYPVGSIYINATNSQNPGTLLGFGTWSAFGAGRMMVGFNSSDPLFDTAEETGGSKDAIVVAHTHTGSTNTTGAHTHNLNNNSGQAQAGQLFGTSNYLARSAGGSAEYGIAAANTNQQNTVSIASAGDHSHTVTVDSTGSSGTNANLPPYITVYMWKRTA
jgi:hypothetical protein